MTDDERAKLRKWIASKTEGDLVETRVLISTELIYRLGPYSTRLKEMIRKQPPKQK